MSGDILIPNDSAMEFAWEQEEGNYRPCAKCGFSTYGWIYFPIIRLIGSHFEICRFADKAICQDCMDVALKKKE